MTSPGNESITRSLTIAIPTFNRAPMLRKMIAAVLEEIGERSDVELLVCDNASEDETPRVVEEFTRTTDILRYHRNNTNLGLGANVIGAYGLARGEYVWFLSDDDPIVKGALGALMDLLSSKHPEVMLLSTRGNDKSGAAHIPRKPEEFRSWKESNATAAFLGAVVLSIVVTRKTNAAPESLLKGVGTAFPQVTLCLELLKRRCHFVRSDIEAVERNPGRRCRNLFDLYCLDLRRAIRLANWSEAEGALLRATEVTLKDFVRLQICVRAGIFVSTAGLPWETWKRGWREYGDRYRNRGLLITILIISRAPKFLSQAIYVAHLLKSEHSVRRALDLYGARRDACKLDQRVVDV